MKKIGFVGLDTGHVTAFAKILNDPKHEHHVPGGKVTVAFPGGSPDFPLSINRVAGFTKELSEQHGVQIVDSPEAVAEACDLLFIETVDGRLHLEQFQRTVKFKRPTFVDKPFALKSTDAQQILALAREHGVAVMSSSSLRYASQLQEALASGREDILGCDVYGPMEEEPTQPGLFWYGCHSVEMVVTAMGVGCQEVRCLRTDGHDLLTARWADGRLASIHGVRGGFWKFGMTLHRKQSVQTIDPAVGRPYMAGLLSAIMENLPQNRSAVPADQMLQVVQIIESANQSRASGGKPMTL